MFSVLTCWSVIVQIWLPMCIEFGLEWVLKEHSRGDRNSLNPYTALFFGHWVSAVLAVYLPEILGRPPVQTLGDLIVLEMRSHLSLNELDRFYPQISKKHKEEYKYSERS